MGNICSGPSSGAGRSRAEEKEPFRPYSGDEPFRTRAGPVTPESWTERLLGQIWDTCRYCACAFYTSCCSPIQLQSVRKAVDQQQWIPQTRLTDHSTMCCCIPLRTAVFLNALSTIMLSLLMMIWPVTTEDEMRVFTGGYTLQSHVIIDLLEISGIIWGVMGVIGAVFLKTSFVRIFHYWQIARLLGWLLMYFTDAPLLWSCELWTNNLKAAVKLYGWNNVMYMIALENHCEEERSLFAILSTSAVLLFLYCTVTTQTFLSELEEEPRYLLHVPKSYPNGAFYTSSLATRRFAEAERAAAQAAPPGSLGQGAYDEHPALTLFAGPGPSPPPLGSLPSGLPAMGAAALPQPLFPPGGGPMGMTAPPPWASGAVVGNPGVLPPWASGAGWTGFTGSPQGVVQPPLGSVPLAPV